MRLNLDDDNVTLVETTTGAVREENPDFGAELANALDGAQGPVFTGERSVSYVVIKITKGGDNA